MFCENLNVLISGDQILPAITPHIGVYPGGARCEPASLYLETLDNFRGLPDDVLILPAHGDPFRNLHARINYLQDHHRYRLKDTLGRGAGDWTIVKDTAAVPVPAVSCVKKT